MQLGAIIEFIIQWREKEVDSKGVLLIELRKQIEFEDLIQPSTTIFSQDAHALKCEFYFKLITRKLYMRVELSIVQ